MKKLKKCLIALFFAVFCSFAFAEKNEVFVLGLRQGEVTYVQVNSEKEPVNFTTKMAGLNFANGIGGPVQNGSQYIQIVFPEKKKKEFGVKSIILEGYSNSVLDNKYRLTVSPNKRGICLFFNSTDLYSDTDLLNQYKDMGIFKKAIQKLLNAAIKEYAGTEWETPLREELEEWK